MPFYPPVAVFEKASREGQKPPLDTRELGFCRALGCETLDESSRRLSPPAK